METEDQSQIINQLTDSEIISSILNTEANNSETESDEEEIQKVSIAEDISIGKSYSKFLETQDCNRTRNMYTKFRKD